MAQSFSIVYRTGGPARFKWQRVLVAYATREAAQASAQRIERMGYKALVHDTATLAAVGLPDTWEAA